MLRKILDAILDYFRWLISKKEVEEEPVIIRDPDPEDAKPQDGSDPTADSTTVEVITDLEEVLTDTLPETVPLPEIEKPPIPEPEPEPKPETTTPPPPISQPSTPPPISVNQPSRYLWCLDNGHGKLTPGKRSPKLKDGGQFFEYEFNRDVVQRIIKSLDSLGIAYYNVVPDVNVDNFLQGRVLRANNHPSSMQKIFVSVHSNAGTGNWTPANGIETWYFYRSKTGAKVAAIFQKHLIEKTNWVNRGIKSRPREQFYVLKNTNMPAILTENGFFNNEKQVYELMKPEVRQTIADAHVAAILEIEEQGL